MRKSAFSRDLEISRRGVRQTPKSEKSEKFLVSERFQREFPRKSRKKEEKNGPGRGGIWSRIRSQGGSKKKPEKKHLLFFCTKIAPSRRKTVYSAPGFSTIPNRKIHLLEGPERGDQLKFPPPGGRIRGSGQKKCLSGRVTT